MYSPEARSPCRDAYPAIPQNAPRDERKLLILDLDETLIRGCEAALERPADFRAGPFYVYRRPHVDELLADCLRWFRVAVWTSASAGYARHVVANLFPDPGALEFIWCAEKCSMRRNPETGEQYDRKLLTKVRRRGFSRHAILAVDDSPEKWEQSYGNLIRVTPYHGALDDDELLHLRKYLDQLRTVENIRAVEKRGWQRRFRASEAGSA